MDLVSYNLESNRARSFKSAPGIGLALHARPILKLLADYSLNYTPLGPITITNNTE